MAPVTVGYYDETEADSVPPSSTKPTVRGREADRALKGNGQAKGQAKGQAEGAQGGSGKR
jgi:hypothetical protein